LPAQSTEDKELVLTLLKDIPENAKEVIRDMIKDIFAALADASSFLKSVPIPPGTDFEKEFLRRMAPDEKFRKQVFSPEKVKLIFTNVKTGDPLLKKELSNIKQDWKKEDSMFPSRKCSGCCSSFSSQKVLACAQCHSALYCSKECQKSDWKKRHKTLCKQILYERIPATNKMEYSGERVEDPSDKHIPTGPLLVRSPDFQKTSWSCFHCGTCKTRKNVARFNET
jgi:MYND finger